MELQIHDSLTLRGDELSVTFSRAGGPGGQNVNKLNTKVFLRWAFSKNTTLDSAVYYRIQMLGKQYLTTEGDILIMSSRFRSQLSNLKDCQAKLRTLILKALTPPKKRIKTKTPKAAKEKRLRDKKHIQDKKDSRKKGWEE